jgi:hypothetical protein
MDKSEGLNEKKQFAINVVSKSVDAEAEFCELCKNKTVFKEVNSKRCVSCGNVC